MGAPNFAKENASKYYVIEFEENADEFVIEDTVESIKSYFEQNNDYFDPYPELMGHPKNENRNFPEIVLGDIKETKWFGNMEIGVSIQTVLRSGYYDHANLDYYISYIIDDEFEEIPSDNDLRLDLEDKGLFNQGLAKTHIKNVKNYLENTADKLINETEKLFENISESYVKKAQFSNGETIYQKS